LFAVAEVAFEVISYLMAESGKYNNCSVILPTALLKCVAVKEFSIGANRLSHMTVDETAAVLMLSTGWRTRSKRRVLTQTWIRVRWSALRVR
jgi:hypothetical protein